MSTFAERKEFLAALPSGVIATPEELAAAGLKTYAPPIVPSSSPARHGADSADGDGAANNDDVVDDRLARAAAPSGSGGARSSRSAKSTARSGVPQLSAKPAADVQLPKPAKVVAWGIQLLRESGRGGRGLTPRTAKGAKYGIGEAGIEPMKGAAAGARATDCLGEGGLDSLSLDALSVEPPTLSSAALLSTCAVGRNSSVDPARVDTVEEDARAGVHAFEDLDTAGNDAFDVALDDADFACEYGEAQHGDIDDSFEHDYGGGFERSFADQEELVDAGEAPMDISDVDAPRSPSPAPAPTPPATAGPSAASRVNNRSEGIPPASEPQDLVAPSVTSGTAPRTSAADATSTRSQPNQLSRSSSLSSLSSIASSTSSLSSVDEAYASDASAQAVSPPAQGVKLAKTFPTVKRLLVAYFGVGKIIPLTKNNRGLYFTLNPVTGAQGYRIDRPDSSYNDIDALRIRVDAGNFRVRLDGGKRTWKVDSDSWRPIPLSAFLDDDAIKLQILLRDSVIGVANSWSQEDLSWLPSGLLARAQRATFKKPLAPVQAQPRQFSSKSDLEEGVFSLGFNKLGKYWYARDAVRHNKKEYVFMARILKNRRVKGLDRLPIKAIGGGFEATLSNGKKVALSELIGRAKVVELAKWRKEVLQFL